jgi:hypothetical protein
MDLGLQGKVALVLGCEQGIGASQRLSSCSRRSIRHQLPHMRQAGGGRIINIVSTSVKHSTTLLSNWSQALPTPLELADAGAELERLAAPLFAIGRLLPSMLRLLAE